MTTRAVEQVDDWDSRPFSGGYRGLHDLADDDFSGIVAAGPTRLCMTSGRVIGILDGTIEDFEDADGTAYEAPSPALPLLSVMQDRSDEVRAQYYTEETSIEEVDRTLTQGNFTGYVELSENVLSGDYYLVYHQGRSMSVAWVGASEKLLTDDEAFDQANDEVGIYEVRPVDIEVIEIPEATTPASGGTTPDPDAGAAAAATADSEAESETTGSEPNDGEPAEQDTATEPEPTDDERGADAPEADDSAETEASESPADEPAPARAEAEPDTSESSATESTSEAAETRDRGRDDAASGGAAGAEPRDEPSRDEQARDEPGQRDSGGAQRDSRRSESSGPDRQPERADRGASSRTKETRSRAQQSSAPESTARDTRRDTGSRNAGNTASTADTSGPRSGHSGSARSRQTGQQKSTGSVGELETRSIPSLDPDRTSEPDDGNGTQGPAAGSGPTAAGSGTRSEPEPGPAGNPGGEPRRESGSASQGTDPAPRQGTPQRDPQQAQPERPPAETQQGEPRREPTDHEPEPEPEGGPTPAEVEDLEEELEAREAEIEDLEAKLETAESERDELEAERDELAAERDELRERVEQLERRIDELRTEEGGESVADRERLSPAEAIEGTNLFVRYASKGDATLEAAHAGNAEAGAVNDNMQIQYHTQFEADDVAVNGEPFAAYLTDTIQYSFVEWVVRVLPYEIRDTGHQEALGPLYDALPKIDRAELNGAITVQYQEDGEEHRSQESFDVVLRDRMGNPLIVANMNESRQPASQSMMEGLITASQRVGESKESLAGAFLVTSSFFEPEAMEAASDATGSGLLSRDKRESFVKLSRKDGFHLCLVEAREENFNLSVPEI